jgi:hypothetical protein
VEGCSMRFGGEKEKDEEPVIIPGHGESNLML